MITGLAALRIREFRKLWLGQTTKQFGTSMYWITMLFVAQAITHDPRRVALIGALQALPFLLLSPHAGIFADRIDRRRIMLACDLCSAGILAALAAQIWIMGGANYLALCVAAVCLSSVDAYFLPARSAAIPMVVPKSKLMEANALAQGSQWFVGLVGLGFAAIVLGELARMFPNFFFLGAVLLNVIAFLGSAAYIFGLPRLLPGAEEREREARFWPDLKEGFRVIASDSVLRVGMPLSLVVNLFMAGWIAIYASVNEQWFGGDFRAFAGIELGFAFPMAITTLVAGRLAFSRPGASYASSMLLMGIFVAAMAWAREYWIFVALNGLCGIALPFSLLPMTTYQQLAVGQDRLGRVSSASNIASIGVQPLGLGLTGLLVPILGLSGVMIMMGVGTMLGALAAASNRRFMNTPMPDTTVVQAA